MLACLQCSSEDHVMCCDCHAIHAQDVCLPAKSCDTWEESGAADHFQGFISLEMVFLAGIVQQASQACCAARPLSYPPHQTGLTRFVLQALLQVLRGVGQLGGLSAAGFPPETAEQWLAQHLQASSAFIGGSGCRECFSFNSSSDARRLQAASAFE
eukprot:1158537-Pelagomonas_calceolata.AAC.7